MPMKILQKTTQINPDLQNNANITDKTASKDDPFDANTLKFQFQNTAMLPFLNFKRRKKNTFV